MFRISDLYIRGSTEGQTCFSKFRNYKRAFSSVADILNFYFILPLQNSQQLPSVASLIRCIGSQCGEGKRGPLGGLSISEGGRWQTVPTHTPFSQLHLWPSRKVIPFTPLLKESLVYNFQTHLFHSGSRNRRNRLRIQDFSKVYHCLNFWTSFTTGFQNNLPLLTP